MKRSLLLSLSFLFLAFLGQTVSGQQAASTSSSQPQAAEIEMLRSTFENQKAELELLRQELQKEAELRKKQEALLETLIQKVENLEALASKIPNPAASAAVDVAAGPQNAPAEAPAEAPAAGSSVGPNANSSAKQQSSTQNAVESGFGKIKFNGLLQGYFAAADQGFHDTFRVRRAELKFSGELFPKVKWTVMFDLAKALALNTTTTTVAGSPVVNSVSVNQSGRILQEAYITLGYLKRANISIGQFKLPLSQEGPQSSAALDTVERALFLSDRSRGGAFGDVRDQGIMAFGALNKSVDYSIGVFNGVGETLNDVDQNGRKAVVGRLVFRPSFIKGLQIGGSGAYGNGSNTANPRRDRLGAELVYEREKVRIKSEFMGGVDGEVHRRGYYAHFGYRFLPKFEGIFRYDTFDPDTRRETTAATVTERDYIVGVNYYIKGNNFKLQLNYLRKTFANPISPSRNVFLANLQTSW